VLSVILTAGRSVLLNVPRLCEVYLGPIGYAETPVTTILRCVNFQKSEDVLYIAAEARRHAQTVQPLGWTVWASNPGRAKRLI
jgi:hypothetical protein